MLPVVVTDANQTLERPKSASMWSAVSFPEETSKSLDPCRSDSTPRPVEIGPLHGDIDAEAVAADAASVPRSKRNGTTVGFTDIAGFELVSSRVTASKAVKAAGHEYCTWKSQLEPRLTGVAS